MMREERYAELMSGAEALLFVSSEPVSSAKLAGMLEVEPKDMDEALAQLSAEYRDENRGIQLREVAGGWRFYTHPAHHDLIERYVISWDTRRLSQAALEALAIIAYSQPITRAGVNAVRGVNSEGVIQSLVEKGLVRELGRDNAPGSAILYGTSRSFLERFGLKSIDDLPPLEDFAPDEESREYIRNRLSGEERDEKLELDYSESEGEDISQIVGEAMTEKVTFDAEDETSDDDKNADDDIVFIES